MSEFGLSISGTCDISTIVEQKSTIVDHIERSESILIDCGDINRVDITFIQLIVAAQKAFDDRGLGFRLANASETLRTAITRSGFHFSADAGRISQGAC